MRTSPRFTLLAVTSAILVFGACASQDSLTGGATEGQGAVSLKVTNGTTGETVILENVLTGTENATEKSSVVEKITAEMGWNSAPATTNGLGKMLIEAKPGCGEVVNCGPYTNGDCAGSSATCNCIKVCPK